MINQLYPSELLQQLEPPSSLPNDSADQIKVIILTEDPNEAEGDEYPVLSSTK